MISYERERIASDRIRMLRHEAAQERLARLATGARPAGPSWPERLALVIGRRFARFVRSAAAS